ncbi:MAG: 30S ribosomal protein S8 [Elusimicrobia bacterium]|nr:30S ribosomal protein S8 [Elusimicrobiota bacterium]
MVTDPIADMFSRVRNANAKLHEKVDIPSSKIKEGIAKIMKDEGYIANYKNIEDHKQGMLRVYLKYGADGKSAIKGLRRVSKSSIRVYKGYADMPKVLGGLGVAVISTSKGLMTGKAAQEQKLGGEVLGYIW